MKSCKLIPLAVLAISANAFAAGEPLDGSVAATVAFIEARVGVCQAAIQPDIAAIRASIRAGDRAGAERAAQAAVLTCHAIAAAPIGARP